MTPPPARTPRERGDADVFRRQRWTGFLAALVGAPMGLALVAGGLADGALPVTFVGVLLLAWAAYGGRLVLVRTPALVVDGRGLEHGPSGVQLRWNEIAEIRPRTRWWRGVFRMRTLELELRPGVDARARVTSRGGSAVARATPARLRGTPSIVLNQVASDPNDVIAAIERHSGRPIDGRFTWTGVHRGA